MKKLLFILLFSIGLFAEIPQVSTPNTMIAGQPAKASEAMANWDTTVNRVNMVIDTVNRFSTSIETDTAIIDSASIVKAEIDTVTGDTAYFSQIKAGRFLVDTIIGVDTLHVLYQKSNRITTDTIITDSLFCVRSEIDTITGDTLFYTLVESDKIDVDSIVNCDTANIKYTESNRATVDSITADTAYISKLKTETFSFSLLLADTIYSPKGNIETLDALTVNTGQGDNELYAMDQNVLTTSDVTVNDLYSDSTHSRTSIITENVGIGTTTPSEKLEVSGGIKADSIMINDTGSFTATLTGCTTSPTGVCFWTKIGNVVTIYFPQIVGTSNSAAASLTGLPSKLQMVSVTDNYLAAPLSDASVIGPVVQLINIRNSSTISLVWEGGAFTASGVKGMNPGSVTYRIQ